MMKRVILTNKQINEILIKEADTGNTQLLFTKGRGQTVRQVLSSPEAIAAKQKAQQTFGGNVTALVTPQDGQSDFTIATPNPTGSADNGTSANDAENNRAVDAGFNVSTDITTETRTFSKSQIEEARLKKMKAEGTVMTKKQLREEWEEKPNDDANQWNDEFKMFMSGLRKHDYIEMNDGNTIGVEIFKGRTSSNDPRYVTFTKGEVRLTDDHFYIQHSPSLGSKQLRDIYSLVGWKYDENCEDALMEKIEIKPENKGKFNATKKRTGKSTEELTHSKNPVTKKRAIFAQNAKKWKKK